MITNKDIVVVGQQPWDIEIGSNCKNIALELSEHNRVLYVNSALDRITAIRHKNQPKTKKRLDVINGKSTGLTKVKSNLWVLTPDCMIESINWIKSDLIYNFFNKINNKRFARSISKITTLLQFEDFILFNDSDMFRSFYLKDLIKPTLSIYYSRDYLLATDYYKYHGEKLEPEIIKNNDLCVANSTYLANYCKQYNPNSFYVGQGCDFSIFSRTKYERVEDEVDNLQGPVIGYVGVLYRARLDLDILIHIAESKPSWQLVLVGPEDEAFKESRLHNMPNVHFTGAKDPADLPAYINKFDVCINPQIVNQLTIGNYPRKIDEYLAMGKPVIATHTEAMEIFADHTYLADTKEEYVTLISKALAEDTDVAQANRKSFAKKHTWKNSVNQISNAINKVKPTVAA